MRILGVDIGGTSIKLCITNEHGTIETFQEHPTEAKKGAAFVLEKLIHLIHLHQGIDAIGVSTAGQVNRVDGSILYANDNIPEYTGMKVKTVLESKFRLPVLIENDVHAAALGERYFGNGRKFSDFLCLTYGTGIGGAIVIDSQIYGGAIGIAAEFGHIITHPDGYHCNCGKKGCYEMYASTTALVREAKKINPKFHNGRAIFTALEDNNRELENVFNQWIWEIGFGITSLVHIFNPPAIIIGGGIMEQESMIHKLKVVLNQLVMDSFSDIEILPAALGNKAGVLGAISLHLQKGKKGVSNGENKN